MNTDAVTVSALTIFPIKSLGGMPVQEAYAEGRGFRWDRRFMVVAPDGRFVTRRECRRMALFTAGVTGTTVTVTGDGHKPLQLDSRALEEEATAGSAQMCTVEVWNSTVQAVDAGDNAAHWLSDALERPVRLVLMPESSLRPVDPTYDRGGDVVSFADGYPYLVISEASLSDLNGRLAEPVPMERFRPNIVVRGASAYAEDHWRGVRIGKTPFVGVKPCLRCVMITVDVNNPHARSKEPLATLTSYRSTEGGVRFGMNLLCDEPGVVRVGDPVVRL